MLNKNIDFWLTHLFIFTIFVAAFFLSFFSFSHQVSAAPPQCFNFDGTNSAVCQPGYELEADKCYNEVRGGPSGTLTGYSETSCTDAMDRGQVGDSGPLSDATCDPDAGTELNRSNCGIVNFIVITINFLSAIAGLAIVFSIMLAGYQYMTARDNSGQVQKAKQRIVWAVVALVLFIFVYGLLNFLVPGGVL